MDTENVTVTAAQRVDWKAAGYLVSTVSVIFLGAAAWTKENPPAWYHPVLIIGMATSIIGMGCRYLAHLKEKAEIRKAKSEAERR